MGDILKRKKKVEVIPQATLNRLPFYLRALYALDDEGFEYISSADIAELSGSYSAQVRKDLSYIGELGTRGVGYNTKKLIDDLEKFLGVSRKRRMVLVGAGKLGTALLEAKNIRERGFEFVAAFDIDPDKVGKTIAGVPVFYIEKMIQTIGNEKIDIGVIAVTPEAAQEVAELLVKAGVKGILNFVPMPIKVPSSIKVRTVCVAAELQLLAFQIKNLKPRKKLKASIYEE